MVSSKYSKYDENIEKASIIDSIIKPNTAKAAPNLPF